MKNLWKFLGKMAKKLNGKLQKNWAEKETSGGNDTFNYT